MPHPNRVLPVLYSYESRNALAQRLNAYDNQSNACKHPHLFSDQAG